MTGQKKTVEEIKKAVYQEADRYHSDYLMDAAGDCENPMLSIGMNYIRFAMEERNLFRFLFQSNEFSGKSMMDLTDAEELRPLLAVLQCELDMPAEKTKEVFSTLFIFVHGYAGLYANNTMVYDEQKVRQSLDKVFRGAICAAKEEL